MLNLDINLRSAIKYLDFGAENKFKRNLKKVRELLLSGDIEKSNSLRLSISIHYIKSLKSMDNAVKESLIDVLIAKHNGKAISDNKIIEIKEIVKSDQLKEFQWLSLFSVFASNGLLKLASIFRENAKLEAKNLTNIIRSNIDSGKYLKSKNLINRNYKDVPSSLLKSIQVFIDNNNTKINTNNYNANDQIFSKLINHKNVAIVGPSPINDKNCIEIDNHDLVVRINYTGDILGDEESTGTRVDISYYGNALVRAIDNSNRDFNYIENLKMLVFKKPIKNNTFQRAARIKDKYRTLISPNPIYYNGSAMMVQNALFDVLKHNPKSVKLYNTTFYLGSKTHVNKYHNLLPDSINDKKNKFKGCSGFAHHDIITNFNFVKYLYENEIIDTDNVCSKILNLKTFEFVKRLEKNIEKT